MKVYDIKNYIYENNLIEYVLKEIGMHNIREREKYFSCSFPDGDNELGCMVYKENFLGIRSHTREIKSQFYLPDIVDLIKYLSHFSNVGDAINLLKKICKISENCTNVNSLKNNYYGNINFKKKLPLLLENNVYFPVSILDVYSKTPHIDLYNEHIRINTINYFNICYDINSERIIFPHFNQCNKDQIVALIGRTTKSNYKEFKIPKYIPIKCGSYKKGKNLYGLSHTYEWIKKEKSVIIYEGEKSVLKSYQNGYKNCVSVGCHTITDMQISLLIKLGIQEIILAFDKDVPIDSLLKTGNRLFKYFKVSVIYDIYGCLKSKESPFDKGKEVFDYLYNKRFSLMKLKELGEII